MTTVMLELRAAGWPSCVCVEVHTRLEFKRRVDLSSPPLIGQRRPAAAGTRRSALQSISSHRVGEKSAVTLFEPWWRAN